jgi:hypothetical protein
MSDTLAVDTAVTCFSHFSLSTDFPFNLQNRGNNQFIDGFKLWTILFFLGHVELWNVDEPWHVKITKAKRKIGRRIVLLRKNARFDYWSQASLQASCCEKDLMVKQSKQDQLWNHSNLFDLEKILAAFKIMIHKRDRGIKIDGGRVMGLSVQTCLSDESFFQGKWCATANSTNQQNIHLENGTVPTSIKSGLRYHHGSQVEKETGNEGQKCTCTDASMTIWR